MLNLHTDCTVQISHSSIDNVCTCHRWVSGDWCWVE